MISSERIVQANERQAGFPCILAATALLLLPLRAAAQLVGWNYAPIPSSDLAATASVYNVSLPPRAITDGSIVTFMAISTPLSNEWIQVDLGYRRQVTAVTLYSTQHRIKGYALYLSDEPDPASWGDPLAVGELPETTAHHPIYFTAACGRYLRLAVLSRWKTQTFLYEFTVYESPFKLADKETGHRGYTNSNTVDVAALPVMTGYDRYQITDSASEPTSGWLLYNPAEPPVGVEVSLGSPDEGEGVTRYAWFKDEAAGVKPTTNAPALIVYVRDSADVEAIVKEALTIPSWGAAYPAVVRLADINIGSASSIGIQSLVLSVAPGADQTPGDPGRVTLLDAGSYTVTLTATDNAGNTDTAATAVTVVPGETGQQAVWTGRGDGRSWFDSNNWNTAHFPGPGASVTVTGAAQVVLSDSTAVLTSLVISNNATLVFTNWNTALYADALTVGAKGTVTCAGPFRNEEMSNNVVLVCGSFVLGAGGKIDLNGKGYAGAKGYDAQGHGPGGSVSSGNNGGGAGHGGRGGEGGFSNIAPLAGGPTYGDPAAPIYAGSGGGSSTTYANYHGGDGGGAIRLTVNGHCLLEGPVSANGFQKSSRGGCGSGGSVFITCGTLAAASAVVTANGAHGSNQSGGGGGGRVAVIVTDAAAQALLPKPDLVLSARHGVSANYEDGELGTLYFANLDLIDPTRYRHSGRLVIPGFTAWNPDLLVIEGAAVQFSTNVFGLSVAGSMSVSGADSVLFTHPGSTLQVGGDLILSNGATAYLPAKTDGLSTVTVGGDLILADGATAVGGSSLWVECLATNQTPDDTSLLVSVGGRMHVGSYSWVDLFSHTLTGGSALFRVDELTVATNGVINADGGGFSNIGKGPGKGLFTGGANNNGPYGGGGYGGLGGFGTLGGSGTTYGPEEAPIFPGSAGALRFSNYYGVKPERRTLAFYNGYGGGLIRVEAEGKVRIDGTLTANGGDAPRGGAGSGGAISIRCRRFEGEPGGLLRANGGRYTNASVPTQDIAGGGGAGRIAIWRVSDTYQGAYSLLGGTSPHADLAAPGASGEVFLGSLPTEGTVLLLR